MPVGPHTQWPRFELVTFPMPTGVPPGLAAPLIEQGAPKDLLGRYQATNELTLLETARYSEVVCFGITMQTDYICMEPRSGAILWIVHVPGDLIWLVNSSLENFIESVRTVIGRFPFYQRGSSLEVRERVGHELAHAIQTIDQLALANPNGFWQTFVDDVMNGDFATEDVVEVS